MGILDSLTGATESTKDLATPERAAAQEALLPARALLIKSFTTGKSYGDTATGNNAMHMGMKRKVLSPCVQYSKHAHFGMKI